MKVLCWERLDNIEKFTIDVEGYKYIFTENVDKNGFSVNYELLNEHGRKIEDKAVIAVIQDLIDKYVYEETS